MLIEKREAGREDCRSAGSQRGWADVQEMLEVCVVTGLALLDADTGCAINGKTGLNSCIRSVNKIPLTSPQSTCVTAYDDPPLPATFPRYRSTAAATTPKDYA